MICMTHEPEHEHSSRAQTPSNVWVGDVVSITVENLSARPPGLFSTVLSGLFALAAMGYVSYTHHADDPDMFPMAVLVAIVAVGVFAGYIIVRIVMRGRRRTVAQRLRAMMAVPPRTYGQLAKQLWLEALLSDRPAAAAFGKSWAERVPTNGPRVVTVNLELPRLATPGDVCEVVNVGPGSAVGKAERVRRIMRLIGPGAMALVMVGMYVRGPRPFPVLMMAIYSPLIVLAFYQMGLLPFASGAMAEPGCVRTWVWNRTRSFAREDSCLVLVPYREVAVRMMVVRRDGRTWSWGFADVRDTPALQQIVSRWSWRNNAAARHIGEAAANNVPLPDNAEAQSAERT